MRRCKMLCELIVSSRLFMWRGSEYVIIVGVCTYIKERCFFINAEFGSKV